MGNSQAQTAFERLSFSSVFTSEELRDLYQKWRLKFPNGKLTHDEFIKEMTSVAGNKKFWEDCYNKLLVVDKETNTGMISFSQYILGVSFLKWTDEPLEFVFSMFDYKEDGILDTEEVVQMLKSITPSAPIALGRGDVTMNWTKEFYTQLGLTGKLTLEQFKQHFSKHNDILLACQASLLRVLDVGKDKQQSTLTAFDHQAAGHVGDILKEGNTILKSYCEREFNFYEVLKRLTKIHPFFPTYHGRTTRRNEQTGNLEHYIRLEDLTHGFQKPCIMDLKMGRYTWEPSAPPKKKIEQTTLDKISTSDVLGFRICGMRTYQANTNEYIVRDKPWGISLKHTQMEAALRSFFSNGVCIREEVIDALLPQLYDIFEWFKAQRIFRFYGSSILLVYDGVFSSDSEQPLVRAKMVDFAHAVRIRDHGKDDSYKFGLYSLIVMLENMISSRLSTIQ